MSHTKPPIRVRDVFGMLFALITGFATSPLQATEQEIREQVQQRLPDASIDAIEPSPIPGIFEVQLSGRLFYVTEDGAYLFTGALIDLASGANLSELKAQKQRVAALAGVDEREMIVFSPPPDKVRATATVFTDIDCPYCRKLHAEMDELIGLGIRIRYLFYPRAGTGSDSYQKAVSVWCAENPAAALTDAKLGNTPKPISCANPVKEHMALARRLGIQGTPMIVTELGSVISGYLPARELAARLEQQ